MKSDARGNERTIYSLRHTSIMYRLLNGEGIDMLTLARNARTSVEMIERFYASELTGEMNIDAIQSQRKRQTKQPAATSEPAQAKIQSKVITSTAPVLVTLDRGADELNLPANSAPPLSLS